MVHANTSVEAGLRDEVRAESLPLVSIGMPVYNGMRFIKRALRSLADQDYPNLEIIVSDNCSTDGTLAYCKHVLKFDRRVRYIEQPVNIGAHANFEAVLRAARGEYFMWAADDDAWRPQFVSRLLAELREHREACVAMCATELRSEQGKKLGEIRFKEGVDPNTLSSDRLASLVLTPLKLNYYIYGLYRTDVLRRGIDHFPRALGSERMFVAQFALAYRFRYVDEILYLRTDRPEHRRNYKNEEARASVKFGQVVAFAAMLLRSKVTPPRAKLGFARYVALYARFVYRKDIARLRARTSSRQRSVL